MWQAAQPRKGGIKWSLWQGLSRSRAGFLPGTDWKCDKGHWVVFRGMSGKEKKKQKPVVSLILTKANPQGMSFGKVGFWKQGELLQPGHSQHRC